MAGELADAFRCHLVTIAKTERHRPQYEPPPYNTNTASNLDRGVGYSRRAVGAALG